MTAFFVRTDRSIAGPLTGVELREAALAGILRPDGIVGGSPEGPWFYAADVGLFSDKKMPLPHPPDTHVPQYQVRGMPGAFQGPFKLRELIGFAARGMLPPEALLQSEDSEDWSEARRYRILAAVMSGELVLIDESGKVVVRNASNPEASNEEEASRARAPVELAAAADMTHATSLAPEKTDDVPEEEWMPAIAPQAIEEEVERGPSKVSILMNRLRERIPEVHISIPRRIVIQFACLLLLFAGVASAFSFWKQIGLQRDQVIGNWIAHRSSGEPASGVSLLENGQCVIFNTRGYSWSGDFTWEKRQNTLDGFDELTPFTSVISEVQPDHEPGAIESTDGFIRLQGFIRKMPQLDGQEVLDLFLRRDRDHLRIGYLSSIHWRKDDRRMEAGWLTASRQPFKRPDIQADLRGVETELPIPIEDFAGETPLHVSEAIDVVRAGITVEEEGVDVTRHESLAYSLKVDAAYMLEHYGMPDEARRIYRFEIPDLRNGPSFAGTQIVRYDDLQFILNADGKILYLMLAPEPSF